MSSLSGWSRSITYVHPSASDCESIQHCAALLAHLERDHLARQRVRCPVHRAICASADEVLQRVLRVAVVHRVVHGERVMAATE